MSWATSYSGSNNIHFNLPPLMSDGRNFATWIPACKINDQIRKAHKITTISDLKMFFPEVSSKYQCFPAIPRFP